MTDSKIIDVLGGTSAVAAMFEPAIAPSSVSEWRKNGIPDARRQILKLLRPDLFDVSENVIELQQQVAA